MSGCTTCRRRTRYKAGKAPASRKKKPVAGPPALAPCGKPWRSRHRDEPAAAGQPPRRPQPLLPAVTEDEATPAAWHGRNERHRPTRIACTAPDTGHAAQRVETTRGQGRSLSSRCTAPPRRPPSRQALPPDRRSARIAKRKELRPAASWTGLSPTATPSASRGGQDRGARMAATAAWRAHGAAEAATASIAAAGAARRPGGQPATAISGRVSAGPKKH